MKRHSDRDGADCRKLQCPAKSSAVVASKPTVKTVDAGAVELICLALHCACVIRNVSENSSRKHFDLERLNVYVRRADRGRKLDSAVAVSRNRIHVNFS